MTERVPGIVQSMRRWLDATVDNPLQQFMLDREAINQLVATYDLAGPWIPVTERVPEPEVLVLCWDGSKTFVEWFGTKQDAGRGVTHWIPYRSPPGAVSDMHDGRRALRRSGD